MIAKYSIQSFMQEQYKERLFWGEEKFIVPKYIP